MQAVRVQGRASPLGLKRSTHLLPSADRAVSQLYVHNRIKIVKAATWCWRATVTCGFKPQVYSVSSRFGTCGTSCNHSGC